jgi:phage/plasmid-associated DNA primase
MTKSFLGNEKVGYADELLKELPSILRWSLVGWQRVRERKKLTQPASGLDAFNDLLDTTSLIHAFVSAKYKIGPDLKVAKLEAFTEWERWCQENGLSKYKGTSMSFGRLLKTAYPTIKTDGKISLPPLGLSGVVQLVRSSCLGNVVVVETGASPDDRRVDYRGGGVTYWVNSNVTLSILPVNSNLPLSL